MIFFIDSACTLYRDISLTITNSPALNLIIH